MCVVVSYYRADGLDLDLLISCLVLAFGVQVWVLGLSLWFGIWVLDLAVGLG